MCARYAEYRDAQDLAQEFDVAVVTPEAAELPPSWNTAPTSPVRIVLDRAPDAGSAGANGAAGANGTDGTSGRDATDAAESAKPTGPHQLEGEPTPGQETEPHPADLSRELHLARWGLLPPWSKGPEAKGPPLFNARVETVADKPAFRKSLVSRRCLVPADGYYEWRRNATHHAEAVSAGRLPAKTPFYITDPTGASLAFAGLYSWWRDPSKDESDPTRWVLSTTILTQEARDGLEAIHDREPIVLGREAIATWLDPTVNTADAALAALNVPGPELAWYEVGARVGSVRFNDAALIEPI